MVGVAATRHIILAVRLVKAPLTSQLTILIQQAPTLQSPVRIRRPRIGMVSLMVRIKVGAVVGEVGVFPGVIA